MALELDSGNGIFTTLPVVSVSQDGETTLDFAHFANGDSIVSEMVFISLETQSGGPSAHPVLYYYDQEGHLIDPESLVDVMGDLEVTEEGSLTVRTEMEPLGELTISTHGRGPLVSGSVQVLSDGPIGGVLRFDLPGVGVAGVGVSQPLRDAIFPVRRQEGGIDTGMALRNLGESELVLTCRLMKYGAVLEEEEIPLAANGQVARFIGEVFTRLPIRPISWGRSAAPRQGRRCLPDWCWSWMSATASSRRCRWYPWKRGCLRNREPDRLLGYGLYGVREATVLHFELGTAVVPVEPSPGSARLDD